MSVLASPSRLPFGTTTERVRRGIACGRCGRASAADEPFCAHCGARVVILAPGRRPADVAATRSLQFAGLAMLANSIVGSAAFAVVFLVSDAARLNEAALFLQGVTLLVVGVLSAAAIRFGIRGLRNTADGRLRRRGWAVTGIVVAGGLVMLVAMSFAAVLVLLVLR
ncbi:hypothetical protein [Protaetiibacter larvae]|uniref:Zinc ribbon domain-containing protein n=1 Tax=Protaetiibacter larvae TaxID=2592654 RepID=A0A5C1Y993_9MICO|nr:hypothetical protein [Protaetiibacter larvae]QEO09835.1 hypothetical protein FLP23_07330 [Protaetiibacter larvae]